MATEIFLGEPPANIKQWIIDHVASAGHADTRFTLEGGTVESYDIIGELDRYWLMHNGYLGDIDEEWLKTIIQIDIGNTVTSIEEAAFYDCSGLTNVMIGNGVTSIGDYVFEGCNSLTTITFLGKTTAEAQNLLINANVLRGCTIRCTDGDIEI